MPAATTPAPTVALLGTGIMGSGMARSLRRAGLPVRAWNRTADRARPLEDDGVQVCGTVEDAVTEADLVVTMVSDAAALLDVAGGALPEMGDEAIWLQMGTIGVEGTADAYRLAGDRGITIVDAPVSGTRQPAEEGKLVVLASGPDQAVDRAAPVFDAVGSRTVRLGTEVGAGTRMKVVINTWLVGLTGVLAESVALAEGLGVGGEAFLDALAGGPLDTPYAQLKGKAMIAREYPAAFPAVHAGKDARLSLEAARAVGLDLAVTEAVSGLFASAREAGLGEKDMAVIRQVVGGA
jgi:3-hydroxyisobutyrate dehydrogenase